MNLNKIRKQAGKNQEEIARIVNLSRAGYSNIENGKRRPSVAVAKRIAAALGFDWTLFFDDSGDNEAESGQTRRDAEKY